MDALAVGSDCLFVMSAGSGIVVSEGLIEGVKLGDIEPGTVTVMPGTVACDVRKGLAMDVELDMGVDVANNVNSSSVGVGVNVSV